MVERVRMRFDLLLAVAAAVMLVVRASVALARSVGRVRRAMGSLFGRRGS